MTRSRRTFTAQEKAAVVKRYLVDKIPVSDLCDELGLQPTQIYQWQKQLFDNAHAQSKFFDWSVGSSKPLDCDSPRHKIKRKCLVGG